jgi:hypothetical protein
MLHIVFGSTKEFMENSTVSAHNRATLVLPLYLSRKDEFDHSYQDITNMPWFNMFVSLPPISAVQIYAIKHYDGYDGYEIDGTDDEGEGGNRLARNLEGITIGDVVNVVRQRELFEDEPFMIKFGEHKMAKVEVHDFNAVLESWWQSIILETETGNG